MSYIKKKVKKFSTQISQINADFVFDKTVVEELKCLVRCGELLCEQTETSCETKMESFV